MKLKNVAKTNSNTLTRLTHELLHVVMSIVRIELTRYSAYFYCVVYLVYIKRIW